MTNSNNNCLQCHSWSVSCSLLTASSPIIPLSQILLSNHTCCKFLLNRSFLISVLALCLSLPEVLFPTVWLANIYLSSNSPLKFHLLCEACLIFLCSCLHDISLPYTLSATSTTASITLQGASLLMRSSLPLD